MKNNLFYHYQVYSFFIIQFLCDFIRIFMIFLEFIIIYLSWGLCFILPQGLCLASFGKNISRLPLAF